MSVLRGKADCGDIDILITRPTEDGKMHRCEFSDLTLTFSAKLLARRYVTSPSRASRCWNSYGRPCCSRGSRWYWSYLSWIMPSPHYQGILAAADWFLKGSMDIQGGCHTLLYCMLFNVTAEHPTQHILLPGWQYRTSSGNIVSCSQAHFVYFQFNHAIRLKASVLGYLLNQKGLFGNVICKPSDRRIKTEAGEWRNLWIGKRESKKRAIEYHLVTFDKVICLIIEVPQTQTATHFSPRPCLQSYNNGLQRNWTTRIHTY